MAITLHHKTPLDKYIKQKIKVLKKHFCIKLSDNEIESIEGATSHEQVDYYAYKIIMQKL